MICLIGILLSFGILFSFDIFFQLVSLNNVLICLDFNWCLKSCVDLDLRYNLDNLYFVILYVPFWLTWYFVQIVSPFGS